MSWKAHEVYVVTLRGAPPTTSIRVTKVTLPGLVGRLCSMIRKMLLYVRHLDSALHRLIALVP